MKPVVDGLGARYAQRVDWLIYPTLDADAVSSAFADAHGVTAVPTMVLVAADGTEVKRWVGAQPEGVLSAEFDAELARGP